MEQRAKEQKIMPAPKDPVKYAEYCRKISEANQNVSEETRQKRRDALKRIPRSAEVRRKISEGQLGKKRPGYINTLSPETRLKLSLATKGKKRTDENCRNISIALTGKVRTDEHKQNIRLSKLGKPSPRKGAILSESTKAKLRECRTGTRATYETRLKMCETSLGGLWYGKVVYDTDPQYCEKWTHAFRERVRAAFYYTCQFPGCGYVWKEGDKRLAVHHINYRKDACCNPEVRPLFIPVCPGRCHAKTNNDRENWERYFTELIESEYNGKCYLTKEEMISYF